MRQPLSGSIWSWTRQLTVFCCFASRRGTSHCWLVGALHWANRVEANVASAVKQSTRWNRRIRRVASLSCGEAVVETASTVCSLQQRMSSTIVLNLLHAVDVADAGNLAEVLLQAGEMTKVHGLDDEVDVDGAVRSGTGLDAADVGSVFGDDGSELLEEAG